MRTLLSLLVAAVPSIALACSTTPPAVAWSCFELSFESAVEYAHPINDVAIKATFTALDGSREITVLGFWDGGQTYRVRMALPTAGGWRYSVSANDDASGIDTTGVLEVVTHGGRRTNPFIDNGWLRVSDDRRSLVHADGTPFFWLADTAWEMAWASTEGQVEMYLDDRSRKAFNVVHMVTNTHQMFHPWHVTNRHGDGDRYLLDEDRTRLNPVYFARLDEIVDQTNEAGMAMALVPIWGTFAEPHRNDSGAQHDRHYSLGEALTHARYVGARYAGHNVVWVIGGDRDYRTDEQKAYWDAFARELRRASGGSHLTTVHPAGYAASFNSWPSPPNWLDFHMYQSSHYADVQYDKGPDGEHLEDSFGALRGDGGYHWSGALQGYAQEEHIPVLNAEANYEDIVGRFWEFYETPGGIRVTDLDVRHAAYWGLLSGSTVGYSYGANGVWSWTREIPLGTQGGLQIRHTVTESMDFPGSAQMQHVRSFAESHEWYRWVPRPDLVEEVDTDHFVAASLWDSTAVVYCPAGTREFALHLPDAAAGELGLTWTHPVTGESAWATVAYTGQQALIRPPSQQDWLLVARPHLNTDTADSESETVEMTVSGANPAPVVRLSIVSPLALEGQFTVTDMLGRTVQSRAVTLSANRADLEVGDTAPGVYVCQFTWTDAAGQQRVLRQRVTIVR